MKIGICGPVNPTFLKDYLYEGQLIPDINKSANAVNTYVQELLRKGYTVIVITSDVPWESSDIIVKGERLLIHIVHSNPGLFFTHAISRVYMISRIKKTINRYIHDIDVLHAQWTYDFALAAKSYEKVVPVFCTVRDWCPYILSIQKGLKRLQWIIYYFIFKRVMSSDCIHFIANSEYTYKCIKQRYSNKSVSVIYNPIDNEYILSKKKYSISKPTFISIASDLSESRKNIGKLLVAFHKFKIIHEESVLKLVGENSLLKNQYEKSRLLEGVEFCGVLNHKTLIDEIDKCTCLIHPSIEETFGNILLEGMARRVLVIGGKESGAVPQVLEGGRIGILCDVTSIDSILEAMEASCNMDKANEKIDNATNMLKNKYSSDIIAEQHLKLYFR